MIKAIRPYFFKGLGLVLLVLGALDWGSSWRGISEIICGLLALFVGLGMAAEQREQRQGQVTEDERDQLLTEKADQLTLRVIDFGLIALVIICGFLYVLQGKNFIIGVLAIGALVIWAMVSVVNIIAGFVAARMN